MKKNFNLLKWGLVISIPALLLAGCSSVKQSSPEANNLKYKPSGEKSISYVQTANMVQTIVFSGQEINQSIKTAVGFSVVLESKSEDLLGLDIIMDTLGISIETAQGNIVEDMDEIKGKNLTISLSEKGKESDLDEAEEITYTEELAPVISTLSFCHW